MAIVRINSHLETYRLRSHAADLHEMAARDGRPAVTEYVNSQILEHLCLEGHEVLVDVGCGDGCLVRKADRARMRIGTVGSQDECERLQREIPDVIFKKGLLQSLPLEGGCADAVVCNAALLYLETEAEVRKALCELSRITRPGGKVWIGEIPTVDEHAKYRMYRGNSVIGLLRYLLRHHGIRTFLGMCRKLVKSFFGNDQLVLNSAGLYFASPENFIVLARESGLEVESYRKHRELDRAGEIVVLDHRFDYIFRKRAA